MEIDDDFMGEIEFDLTVEQSGIVSQAIDLASRENDGFELINPLVSIMQWWESHVPEADKLRTSPEATLVEACRLYMLAHESSTEND